MASSNQDDTRERILDQAERLFADKGFDGVTVRQITTAAGTNLAAVNYHFGSKQKLYLAVFAERWLPRAQRVLDRLQELEAQGGAALDQVIRALAESFLLKFDDEEERWRHYRLIHQEMSHPTEALEFILERATRPVFRSLVRLMRPHLDPGLSDKGLILCVMSVFAQVLHFNFGRGMTEMITGHRYSRQSVREMVEHIVQFSLHGLQGLGRGGADS